MIDPTKGPGDPEGRRLARRQADFTEEACRLAECLAMFLRRSGLSDHPAIELAKDLRVTVFEWTRSGCTVEPPYWPILNKKIYCRGDGFYGKFGVKVFPGTDCLDNLEAHRVACGATPRN